MITRVERVGISTTPEGSRKLVGLMASKYRKEIEAILGKVIFNDLQHRLMKRGRSE
jgi:hypothetical protein